VDFCQRCAWDVECIIDQLECPSVNTDPAKIGSFVNESIARRERILRRVKLRGNDDWGLIAATEKPAKLAKTN
jgi:hypothetical protein